MVRRFFRRVAAVAILFAAGACGQNLTRPEAIELTNFPANVPFTLTFTMTSCADVCSEYQASECSISVDRDARRIDASPSVCFDQVREGAECSDRCGGPVFAFCEVEALDAGTWRVEANGFTGTITVK